MKAFALEEKIRAAVDLALGAWTTGLSRNYTVLGIWEEAGLTVRGSNLKRTGVIIDVSVSPAAFERPGLNKATFDCILSATFDNASRPSSQSSFIETCSALERLIFTWMMSRESLTSDLSVDGIDPFAVLATGGTPPTYDPTQNQWSVIFSFRVSAVVTLK